MNENTDSRKLETDLIFTLDVRIPDQVPRKIEVVDRVLAGIDPRNDLILIDSKVLTKHFLFRKRNNLLSVHYLGKDGDSFLNGLPLEKGKLYLLEKGDILKVGKIEIIIRRETGISRASRPIDNLPLTEEMPLEETFHEMSHEISEDAPRDVEEEVEEEVEEDGQVQFTPMPIPKKKISTPEKERLIDFSAARLIPYKIYGFIVDLALTYFLLGFLVPILGLLNPVQEFLSPITIYLTENFLKFHPELGALKILSLIEFFICFHALMILASLVLGTTPGAFLIGLHHKDNDKRLFVIRFRAYLYALINIVALPLLLFDVPIFRGKNVKELITFSQRDLTSSRLFTLLRRAIMPLLTIACFISPFFLPPPFTSPITEEKMFAPKFKDVHTTTLLSASAHLGLSLKSELNSGYALLPYFDNNKLGMTLYDLKNKKALFMKEEMRTPKALALFKLRYANPLSSLSIPNEQIDQEVLKNKALNSLRLSLDTIWEGLPEFGIFLANGFLFKNEFLKNFSAKENFQMVSFDKKNPALKISSLVGKTSMDRIFLFTRNDIIEFSLIVPKSPGLLENFTRGVLSGLRYDQARSDKLKNPEILEVLEAFERRNYQPLLTYYISEAKKAHDMNDPKWRDFLKKNILQTKRNLSGPRIKNIETSFDDIINSL
ncbi:MAG: FHA domain-containing protein [Bacteriovorax sp.]